MKYFLKVIAFVVMPAFFFACAGSFGDSDLKRLSVKGGVLSPAFSPNVLHYNVIVDKGETSVSIKPVLARSTATYNVIPAQTSIAEGAIGAYLVNVDGPKGSRQYQVDISAAEADLPYLESFEVSGGSLTPAFSQKENFYQLSIPFMEREFNLFPKVPAGCELKIRSSTSFIEGANQSCKLNYNRETNEGSLRVTLSLRKLVASKYNIVFDGVRLAAFEISPYLVRNYYINAGEKIPDAFWVVSSRRVPNIATKSEFSNEGNPEYENGTLAYPYYDIQAALDAAFVFKVPEVRLIGPSFEITKAIEMRPGVNLSGSWRTSGGNENPSEAGVSYSSSSQMGNTYLDSMPEPEQTPYVFEGNFTNANTEIILTSGGFAAVSDPIIYFGGFDYKNAVLSRVKLVPKYRSVNRSYILAQSASNFKVVQCVTASLSDRDLKGNEQSEQEFISENYGIQLISCKNVLVANSVIVADSAWWLAENDTSSAAVYSKDSDLFLVNNNLSASLNNSTNNPTNNIGVRLIGNGTTKIYNNSIFAGALTSNNIGIDYQNALMSSIVNNLILLPKDSDGISSGTGVRIDDAKYFPSNVSYNVFGKSGDTALLAIIGEMEIKEISKLNSYSENDSEIDRKNNMVNLSTSGDSNCFDQDLMLRGIYSQMSNSNYLAGASGCDLSKELASADSAFDLTKDFFGNARTGANGFSSGACEVDDLESYKISISNTLSDLMIKVNGILGNSFNVYYGQPVVIEWPDDSPYEFLGWNDGMTPPYTLTANEEKLSWILEWPSDPVDVVFTPEVKGRFVYVSNSQSGKTPDGSYSAPFADIQQAVDSAYSKFEGLPVTVKIFSGMYEIEKPIVLKEGVSLSGSYLEPRESRYWRQTLLTSVTKLNDPSTVTIITNSSRISGAAASSTTLLKLQNLTNLISIDSIAFVSSDASLAGTTAIEITDCSRVLLNWNRVARGEFKTFNKNVDSFCALKSVNSGITAEDNVFSSSYSALSYMNYPKKCTLVSLSDTLDSPESYFFANVFDAGQVSNGGYALLLDSSSPYLLHNTMLSPVPVLETGSECAAIKMVNGSNPLIYSSILAGSKAAFGLSNAKNFSLQPMPKVEQFVLIADNMSLPAKLVSCGIIPPAILDTVNIELQGLLSWNGANARNITFVDANLKTVWNTIWEDAFGKTSSITDGTNGFKTIEVTTDIGIDYFFKNPPPSIQCFEPGIKTNLPSNYIINPGQAFSVNNISFYTNGINFYGMPGAFQIRVPQ